jgi:hypothetical protein
MAMNADGGGVLTISNTANINRAPARSPDGTAIAWRDSRARASRPPARTAATRDGNLEIYVEDLVLGPEARAPERACSSDAA